LDRYGKDQLKAALKDSHTDSSSLYRGLTIQLNAVFEGYIRSLIGAVIDEKCEKVQIYEELDERLKTEHLVSSAKVLTYLKSGTVNGIRHDFLATQKNLISCLSGEEQYAINKDAFTLLLGNCTPDRLEALFESVGMQEPFCDTLGESKKLQTWAGETSKRRVASSARKELETQLDNRNEIVHGNISRTLTQNDFDMAASFFSGLIEGLNKIASKSV